MKMTLLNNKVNTFKNCISISYYNRTAGSRTTGRSMQCLRGLLRTKTRNYLFLNPVCHLCETVLVSTVATHQLWELLGIYVKRRDGGMNERGEDK